MSGSFVITNSGEGLMILFLTYMNLLISLYTGESHHINKNDPGIFFC